MCFRWDEKNGTLNSNDKTKTNLKTEDGTGRGEGCGWGWKVVSDGNETRNGVILFLEQTIISYQVFPSSHRTEFEVRKVILFDILFGSW